jgi:hypothetical protein
MYEYEMAVPDETLKVLGRSPFVTVTGELLPTVTPNTEVPAATSERFGLAEASKVTDSGAAVTLTLGCAPLIENGWPLQFV